MFYDVDSTSCLYAQSVYQKLKCLNECFYNILSIGASEEWFRGAYSGVSHDYNVDYASTITVESIYDYKNYDLIFIFDIMFIQDVPNFINLVGARTRLLYGDKFVPCEFLQLLRQHVATMYYTKYPHIVGKFIEHNRIEKAFSNIGIRGHILIGPYIALERGDYIVEYEFSLLPNTSALNDFDIAKISVEIGGTGISLAEKTVSTKDIKYSRHFKLFFSIDKLTSIEFPVVSYGLLPFAVNCDIQCAKVFDYTYDDSYAQKIGNDLLNNAIEDVGFGSRMALMMSGLDEEDKLYFALLIKRLMRTSEMVLMQKSIMTDKEFLEHDAIKKDLFGMIIQDGDAFQYGEYKFTSNALEPCSFFYELGLKHIDSSRINGCDAIDAGALLGDTSIILANNGAKNVYAFEPEKDNYKLLLKTIELNGLKNIIPMNYALGDTVKHGYISNNAASSKIDVNSPDEQALDVVNITSIDIMAEEYRMNVGTIKIDVEGYERYVLQGAAHTIKKNKPIIILSIYHSVDDLLDLKPMVDSFKMGYRYKLLKMVPYSRIVDTVLICY